jgi:hypothetical protein
MVGIAAKASLSDLKTPILQSSSGSRSGVVKITLPFLRFALASGNSPSTLQSPKLQKFCREHLSIVLNEHFDEDDAIVFREACRLGAKALPRSG